MKKTDVIKKAKKQGIKVSKMNKTDMTRAIQNAEGNFPCFGTAIEYCDQLDCGWREDCLPQKQCAQ